MESPARPFNYPSLPRTVTRIPFRLPDQGFREVHGFIYIDAAELIIEVENALFGQFDRSMRSFRIELNAIDRVDHERGLFRDHLLIFPRTPELLEEMPGARATYVDLPIWRRPNTFSTRWVWVGR